MSQSPSINRVITPTEKPVQPPVAPNANNGLPSVAPIPTPLVNNSQINPSGANQQMNFANDNDLPPMVPAPPPLRNNTQNSSVVPQEINYPSNEVKFEEENKDDTIFRYNTPLSKREERTLNNLQLEIQPVRTEIKDKTEFRKLQELDKINKYVKSEIPWMGNQQYFVNRSKLDGLSHAIVYNDIMTERPLSQGQFGIKERDDWAKEYPQVVQDTFQTLQDEQQRIDDALKDVPEKYRADYKAACLAKVFGTANCHQTSALSSIAVLNNKLNEKDTLFADSEIYRFQNDKDHHNFTLNEGKNKSSSQCIDSWMIVGGVTRKEDHDFTTPPDKKTVVTKNNRELIIKEKRYHLADLAPFNVENRDDKKTFADAAKFVVEYKPEKTVHPHALRLFDAALATELGLDNQGKRLSKADDMEEVKEPAENNKLTKDKVKAAIQDLSECVPGYDKAMGSKDMENAAIWTEKADELPTQLRPEGDFYFNIIASGKEGYHSYYHGNEVIENLLPPQREAMTAERHAVALETEKIKSKPEVLSEKDLLKAVKSLMFLDRAPNSRNIASYFSNNPWQPQYAKYDFIIKAGYKPKLDEIPLQALNENKETNNTLNDIQSTAMETASSVESEYSSSNEEEKELTNKDFIEGFTKWKYNPLFKDKTAKDYIETVDPWLEKYDTFDFVIEAKKENT